MKPVVILGGGINGAALARELTVNRIPVHVVDLADIASGATAYSSRLIHGGLRYLEHGDFRLVKESLAERTRLLTLARHLVKPLCLHVPSTRRVGGLWAAAKRILGFQAKPATRRGAWLVRMGLSLYDRYAKDSTLPKHTSMRTGADAAVPLDANKYPFQSAYWDAQVPYAERLVVAVLEDARRAAEDNAVSFSVTPYGDSLLQGSTLFVRYVRGVPRHQVGVEFLPSLIVNATGAWLDSALDRLEVSSPSQLINGTAGSHLLTVNTKLEGQLGGKGVYAEAQDGRPFFVLPFGRFTLIGTTDLAFDGDPRKARATDDEISYLLDAVNGIFPTVGLLREDVSLQYCGVRPLPQNDSSDLGAISRDHRIVEHEGASVPLISLVGGKLTTARALAAEAAAMIAARLNVPCKTTTESRALPGSVELAKGSVEEQPEKDKIAESTGHTPETVEAVWSLYGDETSVVLEECQQRWPTSAITLLPGTNLPEALARYATHHEWAYTIDDLVSRRLMLLFQGPIRSELLQRLGEILAEEGIFDSNGIYAQVTACRNALNDRYGLQIS
ncbi:MAG: glycerol-3-phosphate dehydrogenase/oxidase [Pirellulales bacterium]|nr:glycerol-3-phosphate dehydrogenase/oxidase [Pirellulales bacterium]